MQQSHGKSGRPLIVVHVVAVALALVHLTVWYVWRPSEGELRFWPFTAMSALKLLMIAAILRQFQALHLLIGRREVAPWRAITGWTIALTATLAVLTPLRESLAPAFETVSTHLVRPSEEVGYSFPSNVPSEEQLRHRYFVLQWKRGEILGLETLLAAVVATAHVLVARKYGSAAGTRSMLVAGLFSFYACWLFGQFFGLVLITYDTFYLGALAGPLPIDFLMPIALYPTTPLAAPFYVALTMSSWAIAPGRRAPAPERIEPNEPMVVAQANG